MNKNIFIWHNYRSGSTAYQSLLSKKYNLKNYYEPFHERQIGVHDTENFFNQTAIDPNKFIVKATPLHIEQIIHRTTLHYNFKKEINKLLESSHIILITRKNRVESIASMYVATITSKWFETRDSHKENMNYEMSIDENILQKICQEYLDNDKLLQKKSFDEKVVYEDLDLRDSNYIKQTKPKNYNDMIEQIHTYIKKEFKHLLGDKK